MRAAPSSARRADGWMMLLSFCAGSAIAMTTLFVASCGSDHAAPASSTDRDGDGDGGNRLGEDPRVGAFPCSTGEPYSHDADFPTSPADAAPSKRECTKRCGDTSSATWGAGGGPAPTTSALPTGECLIESEACQMLAVKLWCPFEAKHGVLLDFLCVCQGFKWRCSFQYVGGGASPPCPNTEDAGTDASDD